MPRFVNPQPRYVDKNGKALVGGKLNFYDAGTVTRRNTYNSESFSTPNTNPVILDANGRPQVDIFLDGVYKVVLTDSNDQVIWEKDPVGGTTGVTALSDWIDDATYSVGDLVTGSDGLYYRSLTNGNIGLDPTQEADDWERVQFLREWRTTLVYQTDDIVIGSDDIVYQSLSDENQGNDPVSDAVNWSSVKDYFGVANGVATLDADGLVPSDQIPPIAITDVYVVADQAARLALDAQVGDIAVQNDNNTAYILQSLPASTNSNWIEFGIQNFGTAAFRDVGTSSGNVLEFGAGGLLGFLNDTNTYGGDLNSLLQTQFASITNTATNTPPYGVQWNALILGRASTFTTQLYSAIDAGSDGRLIYRNQINGVWGGYRTIWDSFNQISLGTTALSARNAISVYSKTETDNAYLAKSQNLNDLPDKAQARTNLNVPQIGSSTNFNNVGFGVANPTGSYNDGFGVQALALGYVQAYRDGGVCLSARRATTSGTVQEIRNTTNTVTYTVSSDGDVDCRDIDARNISASTEITSPSYDGSSDERLKRCINECVLSKKELSMIVPKMWVWANMDEVSDSVKGRADAGAIAQDLLKIPRLEPLIKKDENGFYKFDRGKIALIIAQSMAYHQYGKGSLWQRIKGLLF